MNPGRTGIKPPGVSFNELDRKHTTLKGFLNNGLITQED
jgi:hypothetical protein